MVGEFVGSSVGVTVKVAVSVLAAIGVGVAVGDNPQAGKTIDRNTGRKSSFFITWILFKDGNGYHTAFVPFARVCPLLSKKSQVERVLPKTSLIFG
jgi:hypothetical protein